MVRGISRKLYVERKKTSSTAIFASRCFFSASSCAIAEPAYFGLSEFRPSEITTILNESWSLTVLCLQSSNVLPHRRNLLVEGFSIVFSLFHCCFICFEKLQIL